MLGSGINPESFKQDYSGFARAAEIQAQGMSNLGASIGGVIKDFGDEKKKINQDIAKGKSALEFAKANYPELASRIDEIEKIFSDVNVSKADQAAAGSQMGEFVTAMIRGQEFNTEVDLKKRELGIREAEALARNEPPMPTPLTYRRATNVPYGGGFLDDLLIGSDGEYYDENRNRVADMGAFARGEAPEVYSGHSTFSDDLGSMTTPPVFMPGENPAANIDYASSLSSFPQTTGFPTNLNVPSFAPSIDAGRINAGRIDAVLDGEVLPPKQEIAQLKRELGIDANERQNIQSRLRFDADKADKTYTLTSDQVNETISKGGFINVVGRDGNGDYIVKSETLRFSRDGQTIEFTDPDGKTVRITSGGVVGDKKEPTEEKKKNAIRLRTQASANILRDIDTAMELLKESGGPIQRTATALIPGSAANALKKVLSSLESSFAIEQLMTLRATGTTLGQVPQSQAEMLAQLMGPLGSDDAIGLRDDVLLKTLIDARQSYGALLNETMEAIPEDLRSDVDIVNKMLKEYRKERNLDRDDNKVPASGIPRDEEIEAIRKKYLTPNAQ